MALDGGGGGGGPIGAGNSYTGPAESLQLIGNHCYCTATPSSSAGSSADTTALSFETGNFYAHFDYIGFVNNETSTSRVCYVEMYMNDTGIFKSIYNNPQDMRNDQPVRLIIPPYTKFEFKVGMQTGGTSWSVIMTGRIYRG